MVKLYSKLRIRMSEKFEDSFGPAALRWFVPKRRRRSKSFARHTNRPRIAVGKPVEIFVDEHWDQFRDIWVGSPAATLPEGISSFNIDLVLEGMESNHGYDTKSGRLHSRTIHRHGEPSMEMAKLETCCLKLILTLLLLNISINGQKQ